MSKLHQLTAVQTFGTHHQPDKFDHKDYRHYIDKGRLLRSRFWWRVFSAVGRYGRSVVDTLRYQQRRRRALRELYRLDDHTLLDIGVDRSRIDKVVDSLLQSEQLPRQPAPVVVSDSGYRRGAVAAAGNPACNDEPRRRAVNG